MLSNGNARQRQLARQAAAAAAARDSFTRQSEEDTARPAAAAAAAGAEQNTKTSLDPKLLDAFSSWREDQEAEALVQREVNRLAHPDVPLWFVFEGIAQAAVIPGAAKIDALHHEACRLHNLDVNQKLIFRINGKMLPLGVDISESPLAKTQNLQVQVVPCEFPVKRSAANPSSAAAAARSTGVAATQARGGQQPKKPKRHLQCHGYDAGAVQAEYESLQPRLFQVQCPECDAISQTKLIDVLNELKCVSCGHTFLAQHPDTLPPPKPKRKKRPPPKWERESLRDSSTSARKGGLPGNGVAPW